MKQNYKKGISKPKQIIPSFSLHRDLNKNHREKPLIIPRFNIRQSFFRYWFNPLKLDPKTPQTKHQSIQTLIKNR
ncbi:hypothetical protein Hanom_Chr12g01148401 [Helianthus anomalus]